MSGKPSPGLVDVLLFRIGSSRYGADASQVARVQGGGYRATIVDDLGAPDEGARALVCRTADGEAQLCVDAVEGVRSIAVDELRRIPAAVGAARGVIGLWLETGRAPVVLIDLLTTLEAPGGPP